MKRLLWLLYSSRLLMIAGYWRTRMTNFFIITRAFQRKRPSWNLGFVFFFFFSFRQFAIKSLIHMRDDLTLMCAWHGVMADEERFMRWKISTNTVKNTLKTDTKYSHSVRGRPTLKVEERCRSGLVRKPYERSLWANIYDVPLIEKHAISTELSNVNREKHKLKSFPLTVYIINNPASSVYGDKNSYEINP